MDGSVHLFPAVAQAFALSSVVTQLLTPPVRNGRGFFMGVGVHRLTEVVLNFYKIYGVLSITEVLGIGGE